jgi:hypothetical protein
VRKDIKIVIFMLSLDAQKVRYDNGEIWGKSEEKQNWFLPLFLWHFSPSAHNC